MAQVDLRHWHDLALHLTSAGVELKLGHVPEPRRFPPARLANQVADIQRGPARAAGERGFLVHSLTPLALNSLHLFASGNVGPVGHTNSIGGRWWVVGGGKNSESERCGRYGASQGFMTDTRTLS